MKAIHRSTRDHSIQFFSRLLFLLLFAPTLSPLSRQYLDQPFDWWD